ncbi:MAG: serine/threonine-protein kinase [Myxococcota bacterium]
MTDGSRQEAPALGDLSAEGRRLVASLSHKLFETHPVASRVGRYVLLDVIGRGGMGVIYRAYDPELDRRVAIKVLATRTAAASDRLKLEARALAQLAHPNVVTVHEVGEDRGEVWLALELVDGGSLESWATAHPEPTRTRQRQALALAQQAVDGLVAAHGLGLVHRDIKPQNLLVGTDGRLRIADFGLARSLGTKQEAPDEGDEPPRDADSSDATDSVAGTPAYMPPEQFEGRADARSDQFSFCAAFFEILYGCRPFTGNDAQEHLAAIERSQIVFPRGRRVPDFVRHVLARGLSADPRDRFPSMRSLGNALRAGARRRVLTGYGALVGGVLVTGAAVVRIDRAEACTDERATIERVAGPEARTRIRDALLAVDRPFVEPMWTRTSDELDALVDDWSEQRLAACRLARDPDTERARQGDLRLLCLDAAVDTVRTALAVDRLAPDDATYFANYIEVVLDAAHCATPNAEVFSAEGGRAALTALRAALLADKRGAQTEAREEYEAILEQTQPGQLPRIRAEAHHGLAQLALIAGDDETMRSHRIAALSESETSGDPDLIAPSWMAMAELVPASAGWETVELFVARAEAVVATHSVSQSAKNKMLLTQGQLREQFGRNAESVPFYEQVLARGDEYDAYTVMLTHQSLSYALTLLSRSDEAIEHGKAARALALAHYGPHHEVTNGFTAQLARAYQWRGDAELAESTADEALAAYEATPHYNYDNRVSTLFLAAALRLDRGAPALARADYERGLRILAEHGEACTDATGDGELGIAWTLTAEGDHAGALRAVERALPCMAGKASSELALRAEAIFTRAKLLAELGRAEESREALRAGKEVAATAFVDNPAWGATTAIRVVEALLVLGDRAEAQRVLANARREFPEIDPELDGSLQALEREAAAHPRDEDTTRDAP